MKIRVLGGGIYGCHIALAMLRDGHDVELHEIAERLFSGASGNIPARLHQGLHYPRSKLTRAACRAHATEFMAAYGGLTRGVPVNLYCIAAEESLVDFGTYAQTMAAEGVEFVTVYDPGEFGLKAVEGALLTGERHILVDRMREHFAGALGPAVRFGMPRGAVDDPAWDLTIDCTFCAHEGFGIDRFEACLTLLLEGPADRAVTIMDGGFPSLYPWSEADNLCSLTSALFTPLARRSTWADARHYLEHELAGSIAAQRATSMLDQMAEYYPAVHDYRVVDHRYAIRALPRSAADARIIDVVPIGARAVRIRAGKLDAVFQAERAVRARVRAP
jgi:hypothetical protein